MRHTLASEARAAADRFAKVSLSAPTTLASASSQQSDAAIHDQPCTLSLCEIMLLRRPAELQSQLQVLVSWSCRVYFIDRYSCTKSSSLLHLLNKYLSTSDLLDCVSAQTLTEWLGAHQFFDTIAADEAVFWHWLESVADQQRTDANEQTARDHAFAVYADSLAAADNASAVASSTAASATASVASASALGNAALTAPAAAPPPTAISTAQLRAEVESLLRARVSQQPALMAAWRHLFFVAASSAASATPSSSAPMSADELSALAAAQTDELDAFAADFCVGAVAVRSAARHSVAALSGATVVGGAPLVASSTFSHSNRQQHQQQGTLLVTRNDLHGSSIRILNLSVSGV